MVELGFVLTQSDTSLFVFNRNGLTAYFLVYVDDLILTGSDTAFVSHVIDQLAARFSIKDLGLLSYFLGVDVLLCPHSCFLS